MARRFRIAASVFFALVAVGLSMQWVRSYWWQDYLYVPLSQFRWISCISGHGWLAIDYISVESPPGQPEPWEISTALITSPKASSRPGWHWSSHRDPDLWCTQTVFPYWFLLALTGLTAGALPWFPLSGRFSLRTLLIAVTLVAVVLGLAISFNG
jgi:hypothetical protein